MSKSVVTIRELYKSLVISHENIFPFSERRQLKFLLRKCIINENFTRDQITTFTSGKLAIVNAVLNEAGLGKSAVLSVLFQEFIQKNTITVTEIENTFSTNISTITKGLIRVRELYERNTSLESENFRKLLLTFAEDVRVILIIIASQLCRMRERDNEAEDVRIQVARERSFLYAPVAHRMGLYKIKTELEDLSLKHTNRDIYRDIARKLNETKRSRDIYIDEFITPLREKQIGRAHV